MPRKAKSKLGDKRFDETQKPIVRDLPFTKENKELIRQSEFDAQCGKLLELMDFFKINKKDKNAWFHLSYHLAEHYVPAMKFESKSGAPVIWTNRLCWGVHALYTLINAEHPHKITSKAAFYSMPKRIQGTALESFIKEDIKGVTIKDRYKKYIKTQDFKLRSAILEEALTESEQLEYFEEYLKVEPSKILEKFNKRLNEVHKKDAVFTFLGGGKPKVNQKNFSYLTEEIKGVSYEDDEYQEAADALLKKIMKEAKTG